MARRRPERVTYDNLYRFFACELRCREGSYIERAGPDLAGVWVTVALTACGLRLRQPPLQRQRFYRQAPQNSVLIGDTCVDGIHYCAVALDGYWSELSPVVLADPGYGATIVVGESLAEFLRLGLRTGYELSACDLPDTEGNWAAPRRAVAFSADLPANDAGEMFTQLRRLAEYFDLAPLADPARRLSELQSLYQPCLRLPAAHSWRTEHDADEGAIEKVLLTRFRAGDRVVWERRGAASILAVVVAVGPRRVEIECRDPAQPEGIVRRQVSPENLRHQERLPT